MTASIFAHWLSHPLFGKGYQFWSGIGSDIGQITLLTGMFAITLGWWRRRNCQVHGCWRLTWKHTAAGDHVCRRHHPDAPKTAAQVSEDHHGAIDLEQRHNRRA